MDIDTGVQFNFTYAPGVSLEQMIGFEMAGKFWSNHLADDVSLNILIETTDELPENVIGGALPGIEDNISYADFRDALAADKTSSLDKKVVENLQTADEFTTFFRSQFNDALTGYVVDGNEYVSMTRANAKALGIRDADDPTLDGYILMRDLDGSGKGLESLSWDYNYSDDKIADDSLDFLSVAIHEIGHVLGFVSGLDRAEWLEELRSLNRNNEADYYSSLTGNLNNATPMDMLRYSEASHKRGGKKANWNDMSIGGNPFLSFEGSGKKKAYFATGEDTSLGGDGNQASHWRRGKKDKEALGIMDPLLSAGHRREISKLDQELFDAIGWDFKKRGKSPVEAINKQIKETTGYELNEIVSWQNLELVNFLSGGTFDLSPAENFVDADGDRYDDRNEQLGEMIDESGEVYKWGWRGHRGGRNRYWWGWRGHRGGRNRYWQFANNSQEGFWQNFSWQTVELSSTPTAAKSDSPELVQFNLQVLAIPGTGAPVVSESSHIAQELVDVDTVNDKDNVTIDGENNETLLGKVKEVLVGSVEEGFGYSPLNQGLRHNELVGSVALSLFGSQDYLLLEG